MRHYNLIIIGAGPAGLSTALHLLQQNPHWAHRMLLLEKAAHPRPKLCGGGITQFGMDVLRNLGFPVPLPLPSAPVDDARLLYRQRVIHVRGFPKFEVFDRQELDAYLAQAARERGAIIAENEPVQSIKVDPDGVTLTTPGNQYSALAIVGADGSKGLTRKVVTGALKGKRKPSQIARLLETVAPAQGDEPHFRQRFAEFDFTPVLDDLQGYVWNFPSRVGGGEAHWNQGTYDARTSKSRPKANLTAILRARFPRSGDAETPRVQGHPIHRFSPANLFSAPRILLVGDAAGADPLFGEGIGPALGYGKVAAQALAEGFARKDFTFKTYRRRILNSSLGRYLLLRWGVARASYRLSHLPGFMSVVWGVGRGLAVAHNFWVQAAVDRSNEIILES